MAKGKPRLSRFDELESRPDKESFGKPRRGAVEKTLYVVDGKTAALPTFELGLVLAGAVSAGAYTAGVLDYLIEALDHWERAKEDNVRRFGDTFELWEVPPHAVRLVAVAGASAGSVCAATLAATARKQFPSGAKLSAGPLPFDAPSAPSANPLYDLWVRRLDIRPMLDTKDIGAEQVLGDVQSLLNTGPLDAGAAHIVRQAHELPDAAPRRWIDKGIAFGFTLGNLTGVPYRYKLVGLDGADFATTAHADIFAFRIAGDAASETLPEGCVPGSPLCGHGDGLAPISWDDIANAALASGAFPVALKPRAMVKDISSYDRLIRLDARYTDALGPVGTPDAGAWTQGANVVAGTVTTTLVERDLSFTAVDGGTMNNQPLEYVRRTLAGPMGRNPREGVEANRAVVLIDPFPAPQETEANTAESAGERARLEHQQKPVAVIDVLPRLLRAYTNQARYDANDLALAADPNVYSRFMLSPIRAAPDGTTLTGERALASGGLNAFAGFLAEPLRHHDFLLGRRNAEYFLRTYFTLPKGNPLFDERYWADKGTPEAPIGPYWSVTSDPVDPGDPKFPQHARQIIPVIVPATDQVRHQPAVGAETEAERLWAARDRLLSPHPVWPGSERLAAWIPEMIRPKLKARARRLVEVGRNSLGIGLGPAGGKLALWLFGNLIAEKAAGAAVGQIETALHDFGLDRPSPLPTRPPEVRHF